MKAKRALIWAIVISSVLVGISSVMDLYLDPDMDIFHIAIIPGSFLDIALSRNVHQGFGGTTGIIVTAAGSAIFWTVPFWIMIYVLCLPFKKKV